MATKKILYGAVFSNGEKITRTTDRVYVAAWRTFNKETGATYATGFSNSERLAKNQIHRYTSLPTTVGEVVEAVVVTDANKALFELKLPFRVMRYWQGEDRGYYETGAGRKHLRFATREEAQAWVDRAVETRAGVVWEVKEDTSTRQPARRKYS